MISTSILIAVIFPGFSSYLPSPIDKDGWGLRVHDFSLRGPYVREYIDHVGFSVTLVNFSKKTQSHDPLIVAKQVGDLRLRLSKQNGDIVPALDIFGGITLHDPFTVQLQLQPGEFTSLDFQFKEFGYFALGNPGRYRMEATLKLDGKTITSPPFELEVIEGKVLVSHVLPLEGVIAKKPPTERHQPVIQQVRVGHHTYLIYLRRLAELSGKVEMTVDGAYGAGNPLTIKYRDGNSMTGWTTLVINSVDGMPWTEEDERARIKRNTFHLAPALRLARP